MRNPIRITEAVTVLATDGRRLYMLNDWPGSGWCYYVSPSRFIRAVRGLAARSIAHDGKGMGRDLTHRDGGSDA